MRITLELLEKHGACREGREWFNGKFPDGGTDCNVIAALRDENRRFWIEWLVNKLMPPPSSLSVIDTYNIVGR